MCPWWAARGANSSLWIATPFGGVTVRGPGWKADERAEDAGAPTADFVATAPPRDVDGEIYGPGRRRSSSHPQTEYEADLGPAVRTPGCPGGAGKRRLQPEIASAPERRLPSVGRRRGFAGPWERLVRGPESAMEMFGSAPAPGADPPGREGSSVVRAVSGASKGGTPPAPSWGGRRAVVEEVLPQDPRQAAQTP